MARQAKNWLIYHVVRLAIFATGLIPQHLAPLAGMLLGRLAHRLAHRERDWAREHLAAAYGRTARDPRVGKIARGVFVRLGQSAVELCRIQRSPSNMPEIEIAPGSLEALDRALSEGRGVIFVTGHIGNWELLALTLSSFGYPISTMARASYDPRFTKLIDRFRTRGRVETIFRGRVGSAAAMLRALKRGRVLGMLIDQDIAVPGTFVPFFGRLAHTPLGPAVLALRTLAPVVIGSLIRVSGGRLRLEIQRCFIPDDQTDATAQFTALLEQRIRRHPCQWVWFHRRWRTRPAQEVAA